MRKVFWVIMFAAIVGLLVPSCNMTDKCTDCDWDAAQFGAKAIDDGAHEGNEHFFFLPPVVPDPNATGIFDPALSPEVQIVNLLDNEYDPTDPIIETFTMGEGSELIRVVPEEEHYIVNWHTDEYNLDAEATYRIRVLVDNIELGFADVDVVNSGNQLKNVETDEFIPLKDGRTLPIKFRIEDGALVPEYQVGDVGPAGGWIFYDDEADGNDDIAGYRYLEAAPSDQSTFIKWHDGSPHIATEAIATAIGTGSANTAKIVAVQGPGSYAAQVCNDLTIGGYSDWFMPSQKELNTMRVNLYLNGVGEFAPAFYWSSSEKMYSHAWNQDFSTGFSYIGTKSSDHRVRAIRAF